MKKIILGISAFLSVSSVMASTTAYKCELINSESRKVLSQGTASSMGGFKERISENGRELIFKIQISKETFYLDVLTMNGQRVISTDISLNTTDGVSSELDPKFMRFKNTKESLEVFCEWNDENLNHSR